MGKQFGAEFIRNVLAEKDELTSTELDTLEAAMLISNICACSVETGELVYCLMKDIPIDPEELYKKLLHREAELAIKYQEKRCVY